MTINFWIKPAQEIMNKVKMDEEDNGRISGPFPLPTTINRWTVLRGPHVNKKSREQFERRTHHRLIDIASPTSRENASLAKLDFACRYLRTYEVLYIIRIEFIY